MYVRAADSSVSDLFSSITQGGGGGGGAGTDGQTDLRMDGQTDGRIFVWVGGGWWVVRTSLMTESIAETQPVLTYDEDVSDRITFPLSLLSPHFSFCFSLTPRGCYGDPHLNVVCHSLLISAFSFLSSLPGSLFPYQGGRKSFSVQSFTPPSPTSFLLSLDLFFFLSERIIRIAPPPRPHPPIYMEPLRLSTENPPPPHLPLSVPIYSV